jgi:hypothetical protein
MGSGLAGCLVLPLTVLDTAPVDDQWHAVAQVTVPSGILVLGDLTFLGRWPDDPEGCWHAAAEAAGAGGGEFDRDGICGVAVPVPTDRPLPVRLRPTSAADPTPSIIDIVLAPQPVPAVNEVPIGRFPVDAAQMTIADAAALAEFRFDESSDGLADVAFWGRDEREARSALGGAPIRWNAFGWRDLALEAATSRLDAVRRWAEQHDGGKGLGYALWPHSDLYRLDEAQAADPWGVGVVTVGGQQVCGVQLPGDGYYPVALREASDGRPAVARVRVWRDGS